MKRHNYSHFFSWICPVAMFTIAILAFYSFVLSSAASPSEGEPKLRNPFCSIETVIKAGLDTQGKALIEPDGRALIQIGPDEAAGDTAYRDFLMAHECCHHTRGHLRRLNKKRQVRAFLDRSFVNRSVELDADCCAAIALARTGRKAAVLAATRRMRSYGARPTGSGGYPAGNLRAMLIEQCAASIDSPPSFRSLNLSDSPATGATK